MEFRERKKSIGDRIEPTNALLPAYRPYAQPVTLVSREKEVKGARGFPRAALRTGACIKSERIRESERASCS